MNVVHSPSGRATKPCIGQQPGALFLPARSKRTGAAVNRDVLEFAVRTCLGDASLCNILKHALGKILKGQPPTVSYDGLPAPVPAFSLSIIIPLSSPTPIPFFVFRRFPECCSCVGLATSMFAPFAANTPKHMPIPTNTHQYPPIPLTNTPSGMPCGTGSTSAAWPAPGGGRWGKRPHLETRARADKYRPALSRTEPHAWTLP